MSRTLHDDYVSRPDPGADTDSRYGVQLARGYRWLSFEPGLEAEFRDYHLEDLRHVVIAWVGVSALAAAVTILVVRMAGGPPGDMLEDAVRLGVLLPLLAVVAVVALWREVYMRVWHVVAPVALGLAGLGTGFVAAAQISRGDAHAFFVLLCGTYALYGVLGTSFWRATIASGSVWIWYALALYYWRVPVGTAASELGLLLTANAFGAVLCYTLEYRLRTAFLSTRLLDELSRRDPLTGLGNRRAFEQHLDTLWRQSLRERHAVGLLLIDVDHFKRYNDHFGHQAGDECLREIARNLHKLARRPLDLVARIGGEEFAILLYQATDRYLVAAAEEARLAVEQVGLAAPPGSVVADVVTVSVGGARVVPAHGRSSRGLVQLADEALYEAKDQGRNCVRISSFTPESFATGVFRDARRRSGA